MRLTELSTVSKADTDGIWVPYAEGVELLVRQLGCRAFDECVARLTKPYRAASDDGDIPEDKVHDINMQAIAETLVLDWRGVTDENDQPLEYTPERLLGAMRDNYRFYKDLLQITKKLESYAQASEGNSESA